MPRVTKQQAALFRKEAEATLARLGAVLVDPERWYPYSLQTHAGELRISIDGDSLMCRFEDVPKAKEELYSSLYGLDDRLNPFSGKWNWHGLDCLPAFEFIVDRDLKIHTEDCA